MSLPSKLTAGNLISWQAGLERHLERELEKRTKVALSRIKDQAMQLSLTSAFARSQWDLAVNDTLKAINLEDADLASELIDLQLGDDAYDTVINVMSLGSLQDNREDLINALNEALGLDTPSLLAAGGWISKLLNPARALGPKWRVRVKRATRTAFTGLTGRLVMVELRLRGSTGKRWVSRHDDKVRHSHLEADGQVQPLEQPFRVGNVDLDYPGQKGKPLEETANCRCLIMPAEASRR